MKKAGLAALLICASVIGISVMSSFVALGADNIPKATTLLCVADRGCAQEKHCSTQEQPCNDICGEGSVNCPPTGGCSMQGTSNTAELLPVVAEGYPTAPCTPCYGSGCTLSNNIGGGRTNGCKEGCR